MNTIIKSINTLCLVMIFPLVPEIDFQAGKKPKVVKYFTCEDAETDSDIRNSISQNRDFLEKYGVKIIVKENRKKCGYMLKNGKAKKKIEGAMTDADLKIELKTFFDINLN